MTQASLKRMIKPGQLVPLALITLQIKTGDWRDAIRDANTAG
jgi:hypothetical protein